MALLWKDKIDGVDRIKAADINDMAHAIIDLENNAELPGDGAMVFKGVVDTLPESANEGEVYYCNNDYCDFDFTTITYKTTSTNQTRNDTAFKDFFMYDTSFITDNLIAKVLTDFGIALNYNAGDNVKIAPDERYLLLVKYNNEVYSAILSMLQYSAFDDGEGGVDTEKCIYFRENGIKVNGIDTIAFPVSDVRIRPSAYYLKNLDEINEYPKGLYIYSAGKWVHM